ncbi:GNAT family N-acetyltransferase [Haloterrigena sp. SYSU A558-1]|uniref:GNAT family N-acetyltransferase n=1 Tax=Haloterrigena gelatinilytica TaxID=2741724 RepID=A0ABX2L3J8_9EURY|nr:GNAT family N-acetyltransferase [Haloterrigena gelatinilytica]NUC70869.1 GNAT family N-acetyltransferase [Haloterrigena gelatinilytica]
MEIEFRPATEDDLELMMAWRSHPDLYENFYIQDKELDWETHIEWWEGRTNRRDWIIVLQENDRWRDVGNVSLSDLDTDCPEVGIYIGEVSSWGKGVATKAVEFALSWLRTQDYSETHARILKHNDASQRVFEKIGFEHAGLARDGEYMYVYTIEETEN